MPGESQGTSLNDVTQSLSLMLCFYGQSFDFSFKKLQNRIGEKQKQKLTKNLKIIIKREGGREREMLDPKR